MTSKYSSSPSLEVYSTVVRIKLSVIDNQAPKEMCLFNDVFAIALFMAFSASSAASREVSFKGVGMRPRYMKLWR
jgi:hypothetical protein